MFSVVPDLHRALQQELVERTRLPFPYKIELELRLGTLEYSPHDHRGRWKNGVEEQVFHRLASLFQPHQYIREELWDSIYTTADRRSKVRVSRDRSGVIRECICKTWIQDGILERYVQRYDARLNLCREIPCPLPHPWEQPVYKRYKQRLGVIVCEGRWRLDMTRSTDTAQRVQCEVELEALDPSHFVQPSQPDLLCSDLSTCITLLQPALIYQ